MLKEIFARFRCKHNYKPVSYHMINAGMGKTVLYQCRKCGKKKRVII